MYHYVVSLRGINLGNRRVKMEDLRARFEELNFGSVSTFIASGNVIFDSSIRDGHKIEHLIQRHLRQALGYDVDAFFRTRAEVAAVARFRPFSPAELDAPGNTVHAGFLHDAPGAAATQGLSACRTEVDEFCVADREFYWLCRIKTHESKVWSSPSMKAVALPTYTMRNLTSLRRLVAEFPAPEA